MNILRTIITIIFGLATVTATASEVQTITSMVETARSFLETQTAGQQSSRIEINIQDPNSQLRMPACQQPLSAFLPDGYKLSGNTTVGIRCVGNKPWTIYLSAKISNYDDILVAKQYIPRGAVITTKLLKKSSRDTGIYQQGYFLHSSDVIGKIAKRAISKNSPITPSSLTQPVIIKRGQPVSILVKTGNFQVSVKGKALMDGTADELIRAENTSSKKIIYGKVIGPGVIEAGI